MRRSWAVMRLGTVFTPADETLGAVASSPLVHVIDGEAVRREARHHAAIDLAGWLVEPDIGLRPAPDANHWKTRFPKTYVGWEPIGNMPPAEGGALLCSAQLAPAALAA